MADTGVDDFADWYVHTVDVDTIQPADEWGATSSVTHTGVPCWIEDKVQLVRGPDGSETVSTATIWASETYRDWFTPGSAVTVNDRRSTVLSLASTDAGDSLDGIAAVLS